MKQGLNGKKLLPKDRVTLAVTLMFMKKTGTEDLIHKGSLLTLQKIQKISGVFSLALKTSLQFVSLLSTSQFPHKILENCGLVVFYGLWGYILLSSRQEISSSLGAHHAFLVISCISP
jgi:hypothetical protein